MSTPSLFVWVPRTGGTSLWTWLCKYGGDRTPYGKNTYHFRGLDVITTMHWQSDVWQRDASGRVVFGFCRDTYSRIESLAAYRGWKSLKRFVDFLGRGGSIPMPKYRSHMNFAAPQSRWLAAGDTLAVDFLGEQEDLAEDFGRLCKELRWPRHPLPHENARKRTFSDGWTSQMRRTVEEVYHEDFDLLGVRHDVQSAACP